MDASVPQRYVIGGEERWACIGGDLAVHPDYRNRGLALPLTNRLLTEQAMIVSWFNVSIHRIRLNWRRSVARRRDKLRSENCRKRGLLLSLGH